MQRRVVLFGVLASILCTAGYITLARATRNRGSVFVAAASSRVTQGSLQVVNPEKGLASLCPLKHTDVKAEISGFLSRVVVTQDFENPFTTPLKPFTPFHYLKTPPLTI